MSPSFSQLKPKILESLKVSSKTPKTKEQHIFFTYLFSRSTHSYQLEKSVSIIHPVEYLSTVISCRDVLQTQLEYL